MSFLTFYIGSRKFSNKSKPDQSREVSIDKASFRSLPQKSGSALNAAQTSGRSGLFHSAHL